MQDDDLDLIDFEELEDKKYLSKMKQCPFCSKPFEYLSLVQVGEDIRSIDELLREDEEVVNSATAIPGH